MSTSTASTEVLLPEQKATRELVASLLDAKFNLARYKADTETKLEARRDAVVREFAKANSADATVLIARNLATAIDQCKKDEDALKKAPKLVTDCLADLKKKSPDDVRAVLQERKARDEAEINKSTSGRMIYEEHLKFMEQELKGLPKPKGKGKGAASAGTGATTPAAAPAGVSATTGVSAPVTGVTATAATAATGSGRPGRKRRKK